MKYKVNSLQVLAFLQWCEWFVLHHVVDFVISHCAILCTGCQETGEQQADNGSSGQPEPHTVPRPTHEVTTARIGIQFSQFFEGVTVHDGRQRSCERLLEIKNSL